jgi:hypothetical protein
MAGLGRQAADQVPVAAVVRKHQPERGQQGGGAAERLKRDRFPEGFMGKQHLCRTKLRLR